MSFFPKQAQIHEFSYVSPDLDIIYHVYFVLLLEKSPHTALALTK
jgi:hypothetical protein